MWFGIHCLFAAASNGPTDIRRSSRRILVVCWDRRGASFLKSSLTGEELTMDARILGPLCALTLGMAGGSAVHYTLYFLGWN